MNGPVSAEDEGSESVGGADDQQPQRHEEENKARQ